MSDQPGEDYPIAMRIDLAFQVMGQPGPASATHSLKPRPLASRRPAAQPVRTLGP